MRTTSKAGSNPGLFLLMLLVVWLWAAALSLRAHDPGLSTLDVTVDGARVTATLSLSAPDAHLAAPDAGAGRAAAIAAKTTRAVQVVVDGRALDPAIERSWTEDGAVHVQLSFPAHGDVTQLELRSDIPAMLARGHRQLLTVRNGPRTVAEHLLDARSSRVSVSVDQAARPSETAGRLFVLGIGHILGGFDHLVFLSGLLLASRTGRELVTALTAFTLAHSITLAAAGAGIVHVPASIVEPLIAASIAWVGIENLMRTRRAGVRWMVVFAFGLVHGLGFAEALTDLGRWSSAWDIVVTLFSFNGGVEAGQLAVAVALLPLVRVVRARPAWNARLVPAFSLTIVATGCYWLVDRLA